MSRICGMALAVVVVVLAFGLAPEARASQATRSGAFLDKKATSVQELAALVKKNPIVSMRYSQHYGMPAAGVATYFESNLKLTRLKSKLKTTVYYVDSKGRVLRKIKTLPAGRLVFATEDGQPVLDWECGNPLGVKLPQKPQVKKTEPKPVEVVEKTLPQPPMEIVASLAAPAATIPVAVAAPTLPAIVPATAVLDAAPSFVATYGSGMALLSLAAVSVANHKSAPPVPEPSAFCSLGCMGLAVSSAFVGARRRRRA